MVSSHRNGTFFEVGKMMDSQEFAGALRKIACVLLDNWGKNSLG